MYRYIAVVLAALALGFGSGWVAQSWRLNAEISSIEQKHTAELKKLSDEFAEKQVAARQKEQNLQSNADKLRREKDVQITNLNARVASFSSLLRDRQKRPSEGGGVPSTAGNGSSSCSGKDLYREDAEFLARLAAEADIVRIALDQCYRQYESARTGLNSK